ncbi:hypothetical protein [Pseudomonas sp. MS19]|uniref:hypothetical protein n=1 Tax=Pseudomonas sp. MS19 TaxID=2579939 RepID=UPI001562353C|nr:hypothetical protein [Pseudomonas sp. MS19]NRH26061.1 hypothetical protein [Pseudomonas sp. MS19]
MSEVRSFIIGVWTYCVYLPLFLLLSVAAGSSRAFFDFFYPTGYKPCNEMADAFAEACANRPAGYTVRLPWVDSDASVSLALNNTGRLLSYVAIKSGWFGLAVRESGTKYKPLRSYRYYYRRSLTGNWFAEIWSVPKSGFIAAILAMPFVDMARDVMKGVTYVEGEFVPLPGHEGLLLLLAGLLLVVCFLPRAMLGRGTHFAAIAPINGGAFGGYGCAQVINWGAAIGGLSYLWLAIGAEWNVVALMSFITTKLSALGSAFMEAIANPELQDLYMIPAIVLVGILFGMAWTVIPAAAFWYVSLRFIAARNAKAQLEALPVNSTQAAMYDGSDFQVAADLRAPQIFLGYLAYLGILLGIILYPISASIAGQAWSKHEEVDPARWNARASAYFNQNVPAMKIRPDQEYHLQVVEGERKSGKRVCEVRAFINGREIGFRETKGNGPFYDGFNACDYRGVHIRYSKENGYKVSTNSLSMEGVDVLVVAKSLHNKFFSIYVN